MDPTVTENPLILYLSWKATGKSFVPEAKKNICVSRPNTSVKSEAVVT